MPAFAPEATSDQRGILGPRGRLGLGLIIDVLSKGQCHCADG